MDQGPHAHLPQRGAGARKLIARVIGEPHIQRAPAAHGLTERLHTLLDGRVRVRAVVIEYVHIVELQPPQALIEARQQALLRAPIAVGPGPHRIARLRGDDELVAVRAQFAREHVAHENFRRTGRRAVVVGAVKVGDAVIERRQQHLARRLARVIVAEVVPCAQRNRGQAQPGRAAAPVFHAVVARAARRISHRSLLPAPRRARSHLRAVRAPFSNDSTNFLRAQAAAPLPCGPRRAILSLYE